MSICEITALKNSGMLSTENTDMEKPDGLSGTTCITAISTLEMDRESAETSENGVCNEESTEASEIVEREEALA